MSEDMNFKIDIPWKTLTIFVDGFYCRSDSSSTYTVSLMGTWILSTFSRCVQVDLFFFMEHLGCSATVIMFQILSSFFYLYS
jgi:hypothetical protein